ncbi:hypothetical protein JYB62_15485 [Algoriphagus lutimaris]|uniref:hypothetical protein n=1 Tax=Algoriphagus lutimaris TaxID=613197 RepID=UPI00196A3E41|nr:hypothetical protein [Algoriphagus lutimaris]MBN3521412.1 hypothetical protein [Algoriphagus lutimaris]
MKKGKQKSKEKPTKEVYAEDWDLENGMGILPEDISLTQNIGCVGGRKKSNSNKNSNGNNGVSS